MKKLTAMLLSLVMCFSLLAIPAQACPPDEPDERGVVDTGGNPTKPGDDDPDDPKNPGQQKTLPGPVEDLPGLI